MVQPVKRRDLIFLIIAGLYLLVSLYRLQDIPPPWYDEMVHLNAAEHLADEGRIWCDYYTSKFNGVLFNGMPLHWILLGAFVKLFGMTLAGPRLFYVLLSVLTLFGTYNLAKRLFDERTALLSLALLASCHIFFHNSRQILPQVPAALFSVMAVLMFYTAKDKGRRLFFAVSGLLSALACLSHPTGLGISFIITILFFRKKIPLRFFFLYLAGILFAVIPYIVYVAANFQEYARQTGFILKGLYPNQNIFFTMLDEIPVRYFGLPPIKNIFIEKVADGKVYNEYFYSLKWIMANLDLRLYFGEIMTKAPFILSLAYMGFKKFKTESQRDIFLIAGLYIFLESFHPNKFGPYIYLVIPYLAICLSASYCDFVKKEIISKRYNVRRVFGFLLLAAFLSSNLAFTGKELTSGKVRSYEDFIKEISHYIPKGSIVAGPVYFWIGMHKDYAFISANQIVYEVDKMMRGKKNGAKFADLSAEDQEDLIKNIFESHKIEYALITCHYWDDITEVPALAVDTGKAVRRYLFYDAKKEKDYLRSNYYMDMPEAAQYELETYESTPGGGFNNVSEEYQKSLKIYRMK